MVALCLSSSVLVMTFWPALRDDHPKVIIATVVGIVLLNGLLAVGCKVIMLASNVGYVSKKIWFKVYYLDLALCLHSISNLVHSL